MKRFFRHFFMNFVKITGYLPLWCFLKPHIYYEHAHSPKVKGAEIAVANHTKMLDYVLMLFVYKMRVVRVLMAEVLFKKPLLAWFLRRMQGIRIDRESQTTVDYMEDAWQALRDQDVVGVFPEARLNKDGRHYGSLLPFQKGAVRLSMVTGAPVRPMYFHNNGGVFKSSAILVGDPIDMQALFGEDPTPEALEKANRYLVRKMEELRDDLKLRDQHREHSLHSRFIHWSMRWALKLGFGVQYHYTDEKIQGKKLHQNMIIVSNHRSFLDPPMICTIFPKDKIHILAGEVLYENKWLARLLNRLGCIKVDRTRLDMDSFRSISDVLKKKRSVGIFPEGGLFRDGEIHPFKSSFVLAAINGDVPVLPVCMVGEYKLFRKKLHIWIDTPMQMKTDSLTVESIEKQALQVEKRMKYLKAQMEGEMKRHG